MPGVTRSITFCGAWISSISWNESTTMWPTPASCAYVISACDLLLPWK
jgi:hypothetical protein